MISVRFERVNIPAVFIQPVSPRLGDYLQTFAGEQIYSFRTDVLIAF